MDIKNKNITYIAGGGGMPGSIIHAGIMYCLDKNKFNITDQIGTSAGSIVGAFYAVNKEMKFDITHERLLSLVQEDYSKFMDKNISGLFKFYTKKIIGKNELHRMGKWKGHALHKQLKKITNNLKFKDLNQVNLYITATDLLTGQLIIFSKKTTPNIKIADAVRASCSIQGIFRPTLIKYEDVKNGIFLRNSINKPQIQFKNKYNFNINDIIYKHNNKKYLLLIDGGNLGNCRIDIGTNVKNEQSQIIATSFTQMNKPAKIKFQLNLLPHTIKIMMAATEKLIIKYSELKYPDITILRPDTLNVNTTDFDISQYTKSDLLLEGKKECYKKLGIKID